MKSRPLHILVVLLTTFNLAQLDPDSSGTNNVTWIWGQEDDSRQDEVKIKTVEPNDGKIILQAIDVSAPVLKISEGDEGQNEDIKTESHDSSNNLKTGVREGRSRGDGFSEPYNDEPIYREPTTNYQYNPDKTDTRVYDLDDGYTANEPEGYASTIKQVSSYGVVSDGTLSAHQSSGDVGYGESGRVVSGYQEEDEDKEGRILSLDSLKNLFGFGSDKHKPPHRPHRPHPGPHGPPKGPYGAFGPPPSGGPYKKPPFKRPPGFIPTAIQENHRPHGAHNRPPHRPHHNSRPPLNPYVHRPHPQDTYIPPKPVHSIIPSHYLPKPKPHPAGISPSYQALDPYPKPNHQSSYQKPTSRPYVPSAAVYPDQHQPEYPCKCVPEYLCKRADTVYHDGAGLIDERTKGALEKVKSAQNLKDDLETAPSNKNDKYDTDEGIVLEGRSTEVRGNESENLSGRSAGYFHDDEDVEVQVDVKIKANREPRIVNHEKDRGRYINTDYPGPGLGHNGGQGLCKKPLVCCKKPLFDTGAPPAKVFPPAKHFPQHVGGIRPQQKLGLCGRRVSLGVHERVKNVDHYLEEANFGDYPWQVAILRQQSPSASVYACGGVLVSPRHVLTVAHCIIKYYHHGNYKSDLKVRLGEYDVSTNAEPYPYQEIYVAKVHIHPYFDANLKNLHNDLAVIELQHPADIGKPHITPICLPNYATDFYGRRCFVSGWGKNAFGYEGKYQSRLKQVDLPIVPHNQCEESLRHTRLGPLYKLHHGFICAGGEYGKDACTGDGGSPLVCQDKYGAWQLAGLVSWGIGCADQHVPGVYVKVSHYHDWLAPLLRY